MGPKGVAQAEPKRKGRRPRVKTKHDAEADADEADDADRGSRHEQRAGNNGNCDRGFEAEAEAEVRWPSGGRKSGLNIYNNPLISISMVATTAAGSERSPTSCASSLWSLRSQLAVDETDPEVEAEVEDVDSMRPLNRHNSAQAIGECQSGVSKSTDSRTRERSDQVRSRAGRNSTSSSASLNGLEAVKRSYIKLINYNKLQCFHLGALIYALASLAHLLKLLVKESEEDEIERHLRAQHIASNQSFLRAAAADDEPLDQVAPSSERAATLRASCLWLLGALLPLTLILLALAAYKLIKLDLSDEPDGASSQRHQSQLELSECSPSGRFANRKWAPGDLLRQLDKCLGAPISVALLILPTSLISLNNASASSEPLVPLVSLASIIYVLPLTLARIRANPSREPAKLAAREMLSRLACAALILPTLWLILANSYQQQRHLSSTTTNSPLGAFLWQSETQVALLIVMVALVCGQLRRRQLIWLASESIFEGASELIEAKVSLEQQRQQQETLLLSVLPAYVAEQVKRNMVKKMESLDEQQQQQHQQPQAMCATFDLSAPNHHHQLAIGTTNVATQTHGPSQVRSLTLPVVSNEPATLPADASNFGGQQKAAAAARQRHSFVKFSRLSTSLASGAVFLSENLLSRAGQKLLAGADEATPTRARDTSQQVSTGTQVYVSCSAANSSNHLSAAHHVASHSSSASLAPLVPLPVSAGGGGGGGSLQQQQSRRGFNELYIRTYNNVSLLYGDIVGFTSLCTQLSSSQLVRVLNNLFSYFDHLADRHKIMRIKILGDCYYGVSGIPEFAVMGAKSASGAAKNKSVCKSSLQLHHHHADNHAINCVNMGLDMIKYIKCLNIEREQHSRCHSSSASSFEQASQRAGALSSEANSSALPDHFELNMRIGIHTGHIHSGVIGLKKWQFDVWSNDVSIAMHCESSGVAGRVQVTEATMQHLNGAFTFEPAPSTSGPQNMRDSFLVDRDIRTYLIRERVERTPSGSASGTGLVAQTKGANNLHQANTRDRKWKGAPQNSGGAGPPEGGATMDEDKIRAATIGTIRQTLLSAELPGGGSSTSALALALQHNDLEWLSLRFREAHQEQQYLEHPLKLAHLLLELIKLLALLLLILYFIDRSLLLRDQWATHLVPDAGFILGSGALLLLLLAIRLVRRSKSTRNPGRGTNAREIPEMPPPSPSAFPNLVELAQEGQKEEEPKFRLASWLSELLCDNRIVTTFKSSLWQRQTALRVAQCGVSYCFSVLIFATVILGQLYLIQSERCFEAPLKTLDSDQLAGSLPISLYQISAFLLLIALDSSVFLLNYTLKWTLIALVALVQVALLLTSALQHQAQLACDLLNRVNLDKSQLVADSGNNLGRANKSLEMEALMWFNDLMLLVLAAWSLAYARKLDYSKRCNFLWRNRLNVDHEELEYISGINKVLLENILPSHVVQHYLSTASSQQQQAAAAAAAAGATSNFQPPAQMYTKLASGDTSGQPQQQQQQRLKHQLVAERTRASSGQQMSRKLVRMSISNMHKYLSHEHELYHEQHDSVAVMFASIPHFYEFYDESDISKQGLGCIALLNEIICDFDKLLLKNKFSRIEKIKTIGSTYMAAAGLRPNPIHAPASARSSTISAQNVTGAANAPVTIHSETQETRGNRLELSGRVSNERTLVGQQQTKMNLTCMIQFASNLMAALNGINKQSFQVFKLRVGVNTGAVIAGIIGAQRPFYDIWGDCVNIASRMESLGEVGRIQVEERTARLLQECLCTETYSIEKRGHIHVKGKGGMVTYFVDKRAASSVAQSQSHSPQAHHLAQH